MTENLNYFDKIANREIKKSYFFWTYWSDKQNAILNKKKKKKNKKNIINKIKLKYQKN